VKPLGAGSVDSVKSVESVDSVDLWLVCPDEIDEAVLALYRAVTTPAEQAAASRFHFERHRRSHLVTRAAVRVVLSKYAAIAPQDWRFELSEHGRPHVSREHAGVPGLSDLRFNISHTDGLLAIAVTRHGDVGVDVENAGARQAPIDVAGACFAPDELAALHQEPAAARSRSFFRYWTLKESYIKARGLGLSLPLDQFSFQLHAEGSIGFSTAPALDDPAAHWGFWQLGFAGHHVVALCLRRGGALRPAVRLRRLVPLVSEAEQAWDWVAASP
jgi:4'-phosphopantetheinyl transferase